MNDVVPRTPVLQSIFIKVVYVNEK